MSKSVMRAMLAMIVLAVAAGGASAQTKVKIGAGLVPVHISTIVFGDPRLSPNKGKSYDVEFVHARGSSQQMTALAAGELNIVGFSAAAFATGIENGGLDLVALADLMQDGPGFSSIYAVRDDSGIKSVKDLKGKVIGINARGGTQDMTVRTILKNAGLNPDTDVQIAEIGFNAEAALRDGKVVTSSFSSGPWAVASKKGGIHPLFYERDAGGDKQFLFYGATRDYAKKNRAALVALFADYLHGWHWLSDPKNRPEMLKLVAKETKQPEANFADWVFLPGKDFHRDPKGHINAKALQANLDDLVAFGMLKKKLVLAAHMDDSIVTEAAARAGVK
jgi:ABC-type nitrate/sulfonate/bicarbonate transport system substrate-binding protein